MSDKEIDLQAKFPEMTPVRRPPTLWTVNGFGFSIFGRRDFDAETYTYIKTYGLCALFIPILALKAYRVVDAENGGWYFIGREPLSLLARLWNCCLVSGIAVVVIVGMWNSHVSSPDYLAGQKMKQADQLAAAGDAAGAAKLYYEVATGGTAHCEQAAKQFHAMLEGPVQGASAEAANQVFTTAVKLHRRQGHIGELVQPYRPAVELAATLSASDARGALQLLDVVAPLADDPKALQVQRLALLERVVADDPDDTEMAGVLAAIYEAQGEDEKCETLLTPHRARLGATEGARVLGQLYARQGKFEESHALLAPYCEDRLKDLHSAEDSYDAIYKAAVEGVYQDLQKGEAPQSFYREYDRANEERQGVLVAEYMQSRLKNNEQLLDAQEALRSSAVVVPVALDLGIVLLQRGQRLSDPAARRAELEKAEKTFLAIQGVAGKSDTYRLSMGQVYYWLGRHDDGAKMFDEVLQSNQRRFEMQMAVAQILREIGDHTQARKLIEEAYNNTTTNEQKQTAASLRALTPIDLEDSILWLKRADQRQSQIKAALSTSMGRKAVEAKDDPRAIKHFRDAIAEYGRQGETTAAFNNGALAYLSLFGVTRNPSDFEQAVTMLERAVSLKPDDSILLSNAAETILTGAMTDIIGDAIDLKTLRRTGSIDTLGFLYDDESGRKAWSDRVAEHAGVRKSLDMYSKVLILAPKDGRPFANVFAVHDFTRNVEELSRLVEHGQTVEFDQSDADQKTLDFIAGKDEAKHRQELLTAIERGEEALRAVKDQQGVTLAVAAATLAEQKLDASRAGVAVDADEIVSLAEQAQAAAPSRATRGALVKALLFRADRDLAKQSTEYAAMVTRCRRSAPSGYRVAAALSRDEAARAALLGNADVKRALQLLKESQQKSPEDRSAWAWALFEHADPAEAAQIAQYLRESEQARLTREVARLFPSIDGSRALFLYWDGVVCGDDSEGLAALRRCAERGVPLPFDGR